MTGGTDNHLILWDLTALGVSGRHAAAALDEAGLTANANTVPFDPRSAFDPSGLRLGTAAATTRGMGTSEMLLLAELLNDGVRAAVAGRSLDRVSTRVRELTAAFPPPPSI